MAKKSKGNRVQVILALSIRNLDCQELQGI